MSDASDTGAASGADGSSVLDDIERELTETGRSLSELLDDARNDRITNEELVRELRTEAADTGRSLADLLREANRDAGSGDQDLLTELRQEMEQTGKDLVETLRNRRSS